MPDDKTQHFGKADSFEERLLAHLDAMEARYAQFEEMSKKFYSTMSRDSQEQLVALQVMINELGSRVLLIETQVEERLKETRPILEKALAEIMVIGENVKEIKGSVALLVEDVHGVRARQREADIRLKEFESLLNRG